MRLIGWKAGRGDQRLASSPPRGYSGANADIAGLTKGTAGVLLQRLNVRLFLNLYTWMTEAHRRIRIVSVVFDPWNPKYCCSSLKKCRDTPMRSSSTETPLSLSTPILATVKALAKSFSLKNRPLLWRILYARSIRFKDHFSFPWLEPWGDFPWFFMRIWWNLWRRNTWMCGSFPKPGTSKVSLLRLFHTECDGSFYVSTWLGCCAQVFV